MKSHPRPAIRQERIVLKTHATLNALMTYIDHQEEHHRTRTFQEEYRAFLTKYGVAYDERYAWA